MTAAAEARRVSVELTEPVSPGERLLDRYRIVRRLAAGGHSVVYLADDERLRRPVCVKVFHKLFDHEGIFRTTYEHFVQEAFALSRLTHPNTLRIYDFGHLDHAQLPTRAAPFQVTEFMNGGTLSRVVRRQGPFGSTELLRVTTALCGALTEAHAQGIIHRDLKPRNILFGEQASGRIPKLADFGIAKSFGVQGDKPLSHQAGDTKIVAGQLMVMCSPNWAAPELLLGGAAKPSTDLYSLALLVLYMYSGKMLFHSTNPSESLQERTGNVQRIAALAQQTGLGGRLVPFLQRATSFQRELRPQTAESFLEELVSCLAPSSAVGTPATGQARIVESQLNGGQAASPEAAALLSPTPAGPAAAEAGHPELHGATTAPVIVTPQPDPAREPELHGALTAPASAAPARAPVPLLRDEVVLSAPGQQIAGRTVELVALEQSGESVDLTAPDGRARLRITTVPSGRGGFGLHIKGLDCFIAPAGGRPSAAVSLEQNGTVTLQSPSMQALGRIRVCVGELTGQRASVVFDGTRLVVPGAQAGLLFALDFGPGSACVILCTGAAAQLGHGPDARGRRSNAGDALATRTRDRRNRRGEE